MGEVIDMLARGRPGPRSTQTLIVRAAEAIISTSLIHEMGIEDGRPPSAIVSKVMYQDMNKQLDALDPAEQEEAWRRASQILDD